MNGAWAGCTTRTGAPSQSDPYDSARISFSSAVLAQNGRIEFEFTNKLRRNVSYNLDTLELAQRQRPRH